MLTPYLSSLWLALVTPASFEIGRHLIEGLKNPTVVRDTRALEVFPIRPMTSREAIEKALTGPKEQSAFGTNSEETSALGSDQARARCGP